MYGVMLTFCFIQFCAALVNLQFPIIKEGCDGTDFDLKNYQAGTHKYTIATKWLGSEVLLQNINK